jgi:DNA-binding SARP family transcriptional activator/predicted ATPase
MTRLSVRLLGALQVTLEGTPITGFQSNKERALLAYLAEESGQPHTREKLAGLLWPERTESAARNNLRRALSNLRRTIGDHVQDSEPFLLVNHRTIRLNSAADSWIDTQAFSSLLASPRHLPPPRLAQAIDLYRGGFLEGFFLADSPAFEEWSVLCRERYQRLMRETLYLLVGHYQAQGDHERALQLAWRLVDFEPWWEEAHRQVIWLLALSGRRSEALAQYLRCRRLLAEELDVAPSPETTDLYERIRDGSLAGTTRPLHHRPAPTHNLPLASGPFVGREAEMAEIQHCLQVPACRLLTLVGAGGMGKTRLALKAVRDWMSQLQEDGPEGVTFVPLAPVQTAEAIAPAIAQAAGFALSPGREPGQQLLETLRQKRWLLILDSFEHLLDGAGFVAEILRTAPCVKVLVTSRARLNLRGEYCLPVTGIEYPEQIPKDARKVRAFAAVELFMQAVHQVQPTSEPADTDLAEIARICRLVQGMPLGILLAAAWSGVLRPAEIAGEIDRGLDFLRADWPDVPERQRSLRAVFDRSWHLLDEREREVFQALSVFTGGFTRSAAQQVSGASLHGLKGLVDKSLLEHTPSGRYKMHELLRQYAAGKLDSQPNLAKGTRDRHCACYITALERWEADLFGSRQQEAMIEMEADIENLRAAWTWAVEREQVVRLGRAIWVLVQFYWHSGRYREAEATFSATAAAVAAAVDAVTPSTADKATYLRVWVQALAWQSSFLRAMGHRDTARKLQNRCLTILKHPALSGQDTRIERAILSWCMGATVCMADYALGRQLFDDSHALFRQLGHQWGMAWTLNSSGSMSRFLGEYRDATRRFEEGLAIFRTLGNYSGIAGSLSRLAGIACLDGHFEEAERLAQEGVATALEGGIRSEWAYALLVLGDALEKTANFPEAHAVSQQSLALYCEMGQHTYVTEAHNALGSIAMHRGRYKEARDHAQTSLELARAHGPPYCIGANLLLFGCLDLAEGECYRAHQSLEEGLAAYQESRGGCEDLSRALAGLASAAQGLGDTQGARQHLRLAVETAVESEAVLPLLWLLPAMALLLANEGEIDRAVELYALASRYPFVAKSRWFEDAAGSRITALAANLPETVLTAARERGQARELNATVGQLLTELCG